MASLSKATNMFAKSTQNLAKSTQNLVSHATDTMKDTTERLANSTDKLMSYYRENIPSFAGLKSKSNLNDSELNEEEIAIRCQINFERLLHKTLELVSNADKTIPSPHRPPLFIQIEQYYKSLQTEFKILNNSQNIKNIKYNLFPKFQSDLNVIKNWIFNQNKIRNAQNEENNDIKNKNRDILNAINAKKNAKDNKITDWRLRKRRKVMRFSEKLAKEYEDKRIQNEDEKNNDNEQRRNRMNEVDEREELVSELKAMTSLLLKGVQDLRETVKEDKKVVKDLDEETYVSLDSVSAVNNRLRKYVESTSGMTCTMCLMITTVFITWFWCFFIIYFI